MTMTLYTFSFVASLAGLALWFFFQENKKISILVRLAFWGGLLSYLTSVFLADASIQDKFFFASRDFIVLASTVALLTTFKTKKAWFLAFLFSALGAIYFFYIPKMETAFITKNTNEASVNSNLPTNNWANEAELLVELTEKNQFSQLQGALAQYDLQITPAFKPNNEAITELDDYFLINIPTEWEKEEQTIFDLINKLPFVEWVEGNEAIQIKPIPSETQEEGKRQYGINDPSIAKLWGFEQMEMDKLYQLLQNKSVKPKKRALVAILDTGIDAKHEDLADNYKSIKRRYDTDGNQHGTHCAGIAAAVSNNGLGIASFSADNQFTQVASVRVLSSFGSGTEQGVIKGILEAADAGADVISLSLGARSNARRQKAYKEALNYANKKGAIVIAAAGNSNMNAKDYSPANTPGIITVSAVDEQLNRAKFSNFVQDVPMGIAAPGVNIYSTIPNNKYQSFNGTSMATPYVAGLVGLMRSIEPELTTKEAYRILKETGKTTQNANETGQFIQPANAIDALLK